MGKKELEHFYLGDSYGGNQDWFRSVMMRKGGCAAETACDCSLYFALHKDVEGIYPFDKEHLTKEKYVDFAHIMEKHLWPRIHGVNRLELFTEGYSDYLREQGVDSIRMREFSGRESFERAAEVLVQQIDDGYPVPVLILRHKDREMEDYVWHWFLINGYDRDDMTGELLVKTVTYSEFRWVDLRRLWDTGETERGGFILFTIIRK